MEKIPNWLRYILAIPFGILSLFVVYYIGYFSNLYVASPDSIMMAVYDFTYSNFFNVIVMIYSMNYMLPKHQFKFTLVISILFCALGFVGLGMNILLGDITFIFILGFILNFVAFIICCVTTFNQYEKDKIIEKSNISHCPSCSYEVSKSDEFCNNCGARLK